MIFASVEAAGIAIAATGAMAVALALVAGAVAKPGAILSRGAEARYVRVAVRVGLVLAALGLVVIVAGIWA